MTNTQTLSLEEQIAAGEAEGQAWRDLEAKMKAKDKKAAASNKMIGRYLEFPIGDSAAWYEIIRVNKNLTVTLKSIPLWDKHTIHHITANKNRIPLTEAKSKLEFADTFGRD